MTGELRCPHCGAPWRPEDLKGFWVECPYCGNHFPCGGSPVQEDIETEDEGVALSEDGKWWIVILGVGILLMAALAVNL